MTKEPVVVRTYNSEIEAQIARGLLENEGIEAKVISDDCGGMYPPFQQQSKGVRLFVPAAQAERAREILELKNGASESDDFD
jgi:hypothetical protein